MDSISSTLELPRSVNVYWINLSESVGRRQRMQKRLAEIGWSNRAHRIEATNAQEAEKLVADKVLFQTCRNKSVPACAISHVRAMQRALADGCSHAIVLEDDVTFDSCKQWKCSLQDILECADSDSEVLLLSWFCASPRTIVFLEQQNRQAKLWVDHKRLIYGSFAYMISRCAMNAIVRDCVNALGLFDVSTKRGSSSSISRRFHRMCPSDHLIVRNRKVQVCTIPLFLYEAFDSTIHENAVHSHRKHLDYMKTRINSDEVIWARNKNRSDVQTKTKRDDSKQRSPSV